MAQNVNEAVFGVTGAIYSFPTDGVIEYGVDGDLPVGAVEHGYANEDGITVTGSRSTTNVFAWQNATLVRTLVTEASVTYVFTLMQTNDDNEELFYGVSKNSTTGAYHWDPSKTGGKKSFVIDVIDEGADKKIRYYIPSGEVTEVGEISITNSTNIGYNVTITAYKTEVEGEAANTLVWSGAAPTPGS